MHKNKINCQKTLIFKSNETKFYQKRKQAKKYFKYPNGTCIADVFQIHYYALTLLGVFVIFSLKNAEFAPI